MNSLPLRVSQKNQTGPVESCPESGFAKALSRTADFPYVTFAPLHYEPNYAYPLIVWLHGTGDTERQLVRIMPMVSMRNYLGVAPRGVSIPVESKPENASTEKTAEQFGWSQDDEAVDTAAARILSSVEAAGEKFHFSTKRVFLAGFDTGGTMAFRIAAEYPQRFAGVISLGGRLPTGCNPFGSLNALRKLPIFIGSGRDSTVFRPTDVCEDLRLLHTAGFSLTIRQYPCRQELTAGMLRDVDRWIIEQVTS